MIKKTLIIVMLIILANVSNSYTANIENQKLRTAQHDFNKNDIIDLGDAIIVLQILSGGHKNDNVKENAGIILDGSMNSSLALPELNGLIEIPSYVGLVKGKNLFHSFEDFNIPSNKTATFNGSDSIENIIIRITGDEASFIDGQFKSDLPGANIYLMNPNGVMIGENASIDLTGSLHISTADYLLMESEAHFPVNAEQTELSISEPSGFGFLDNSNGKIEIINNNQLTMPPDKAISFIGSEIVLKNSKITASEGEIIIASLTSCEIRHNDNGLTMNAADSHGNIIIDNHSKLIVDGAGSGKIYILGGEVLINADSLISASSWENKNGGIIDIQANNLNLGDASVIQSENIAGESNTGGDINIIVSEAIYISNASRIVSSTTNSNAGSIDIQAKNISMIQGANISTHATGFGAGGEISISVTEEVLISDSSRISLENDAAGNLHIAGDILFINGAEPVSQGHDTGKGGHIIISSENDLTENQIIME